MMDFKQLPKLGINTLIVTLGAMGALFCLATAFELMVQVIPLLFVTVVLSALFSFCFLSRRGLLLLIPFAALVLFLVFGTGFFDGAGASLQQVTHDILLRFSSAYPNLSFFIPPEPEGLISRDCTLLFAIFSAALSLWLAWGVGYRSCLITVAGTLPFLLLCVTINDTPPHVFPLVLLLSSWISVLLSKERDGEPASMDATRTGLVLMAVLLLLAVIGVVYPKEDTRNQELPEVVQNMLNHLPGPVQSALSRESTGFMEEQLGADTAETLDLTTQGVRDRKDTVMLQVSATEEGVLYLRGAAKDIYTGTSWESRAEAGIEGSVYSHTSIGSVYGTEYQAAVEIRNLHDNATVAFTPYGFINCPGAENIVSDLRVSCFQDDYVCSYWPDVGSMDLRERPYTNAEYDAYVEETCLGLPDGVRQTLRDLAVEYGYDPELGELETVAWVAEFLRTIGTYRLDVSRQPVNYDFAVYFLTESREGYCVHFATAAAVMLRALDVPSRYASGYRARVEEAGGVTDVTDMDTHAWAEFYLSGLGWIPLETTPGFGASASLPEVGQIPQEPDPQEATEEESGDETQEQEAQTEPEPEPEPEPEGGQEAPEPSPSPEPQQEGSPEGPAAEVPQEQPQPEPEPEPEPERSLMRWYLILVPVWLLLIAGIMALRRVLMRRQRIRRFTTGTRNQRLIEQWGYLEKLQPWGVEIPDGMEALALKAKFSLHEITEEELTGFTKVVKVLAKGLQKSLKGWRSLAFRWLFNLDL